MKTKQTINMDIAIVTSAKIADIGAGDWMQAINTAKALINLGHKVTQYLLGKHDVKTHNSGLVCIENVCDLPEYHDVIHFIPAPVIKPSIIGIIRNRKHRQLLVASTIFWNSLTHRLICSSDKSMVLTRLKYYSQLLMPILSRTYRRFENYDLLLPNSFIEIDNVKKYFNVPPTTIFGKVPNGINKIPEWASSCVIPDGLVANEYILYPGVFSPRKNQLGFIRAMGTSGLTVVFMGGATSGQGSKEYYDQCRREAGRSFVFVGQVDNGSEKFYGILRGARIACLASSCETPGIALIEAASMGARPVMTKEGSGIEYFGFDAEYFDPMKADEILKSVRTAWFRGRLLSSEIDKYRQFTWERTARLTYYYYVKVINELSLHEEV